MNYPFKFDWVGLCKECEQARVIQSDKGSLFYYCLLSERTPEFPKYPRLPVLQCHGFKPLSTGTTELHSNS